MSSRWTQLTSQLRAGVQALSLRAQKKMLVGSDRAGNRYFVQVGAEHKRWVEHPGSENLGDSRTVPLAWYGWLRHTRAEAPTVEEVDAEAAAQAALQQRVAALNAADAKLRLQEMAEKNIGGACAAMRCVALRSTLLPPTARAYIELRIAHPFPHVRSALLFCSFASAQSRSTTWSRSDHSEAVYPAGAPRKIRLAHKNRSAASCHTHS